MAKSKNGESSLLTTGAAAMVVSCLAYAYSLPIVALTTGIIGAGGILLGVLDITSDWEKIFRGCGLYKKDEKGKEHFPRLQEKIQQEQGLLYRFNVVPGIGLNDLLQQQERIQNYLGKQIEITYNNKNFFIYVLEESLKSNYKFELPEKINALKGITFPVGFARDGLQTITLDESEPNLLIAGMAGSGKSTSLRAIICSLILLIDKYNLNINIHLCDFKFGAEFNVFRRCKFVKTFSRTVDEAYEVLKQISNEIDRRYELFYQNNVVDIVEYNQKFKNKKLHYEILFIDEFAELQHEKEHLRFLEKTSSKARACGIHMCISTQRPDSNVVTGRIKANFPATLGLRTLNEVNSRIIWDSTGLEKLRGKGHFLARAGGKEFEGQGMNITQKEVRELIKHTYKEEKQNTFIEKKDEKKQDFITDFSFLKED